MIAGVINAKHVLLHSRSIVSGFGMRFYFRCLRAIVSKRQTTFVELAWRAQPAID